MSPLGDVTVTRQTFTVRWFPPHEKYRVKEFATLEQAKAFLEGDNDLSAQARSSAPLVERTTTQTTTELVWNSIDGGEL